MQPALYLIPVTLGPTPPDQVLPRYNHDIIVSLRHFIVEEERTARRFLKQVDSDIRIDDLTFSPMGKHADAALFRSYLRPLTEGESVGVISEAGCPAIADPGADIVAIAQEMGLKVVPLVGPSSILMALMASGFNGQSFAFNGYLPIGAGARTAAIKRLESRAYAEDQTQIFIETPYRNAQMMSDLLQTCRPQTRICVAAGITCADEYIRTHTAAEWKHIALPDLKKTPAIFLIHCPELQNHAHGRRH
jgi:16S rRNA (cytidine1402-2'-O)-methyltransferase